MQKIRSLISILHLTDPIPLHKPARNFPKSVRRNRIHPFCITIDEHAAEYLPQLYGQANCTVLEEVGHPPLKIIDIYQKLTT